MEENKMKQWRGLWLPAEEQHLIDWMQKSGQLVDGKPTYQYPKYLAARKYCLQRRRAIDVGGNLGFWARVMIRDFQTVESFEPVASYRECLVKNAPGANVHPFALGESAGYVSMVKGSDDSCGDTAPQAGALKPGASVVEADVEQKTLDSFEFKDVDLIKIDCEGYELFVLRGALQTLHNNRPVIIVEQKPGRGSKFQLPDTAAVDYLRALGYDLKEVISGDYVMVYRGVTA
jgi:FkbM family methyltransferase